MLSFGTTPSLYYRGRNSPSTNMNQYVEKDINGAQYQVHHLFPCVV